MRIPPPATAQAVVVVVVVKANILLMGRNMGRSGVKRNPKVETGGKDLGFSKDRAEALGFGPGYQVVSSSR